MTTTSSLSFPTMEVPAAEDSMEMASPYQGQADDFDIDIDLMEDQVSNMDSDMMGADDYPTSQPALFPNDANNDADMADGPSEGSMVDADDYVDEDQDIEVQDEEVTLEAEMQEGDQGVNAGVSELPTIQIDTVADESTKPTQSVTEPVEQAQSQQVEEDANDLAKTGPASLQPQQAELDEQVIKVDADEPENSQLDQAKGAEEAQADVAAHTTELAEESVGTKATDNEDAEGSEAHVEHVSEDPNTAKTESVSREAKHEQSEGELRNESQEHQHDDSLHPVKVLYQDNEISLFPPLEGDSAETFFLHDEDLAYDTVGKMFGSLREVLLDNVTENEVLVIDIDSLGIQITEDSSSTSKMTLHQILDIYLRLCHNEGTDEPEALYLTLTSKSAVHSELEGLAAAANEGKGLSHIHTWDEGDDDGVLAEDVHPQGTAPSREESHVDQTSAQPLPQSGEDVQAEARHEDESQDAKTVETAKEETEFAPLASDHAADVEETGSKDVVDDVQHAEAKEARVSQHLDDAQPTHVDEQDDDRYDSEAHKTESSTTVVEAIATNEHVDNAPPGGIESVAEQDVTNDLEGEGADREEFDEEQAESNTFQEHDEYPYEESLTEGNEDHDQAVDQHESVEDREVTPDDVNAPTAEVNGDEDHVSHQQSESTLEKVAHEATADQAHTPEAEDDLFGISEDLMQTPAKDRLEGQQDHAEAAEEGLEHSDEYEDEDNANDDELEAPSADQNDADGQQSAADDFDDYYPPPDLEVTEAIELGGTDTFPTDFHDNLSTKRSRDEEEEWDIADTTSPDTKRRRS